MSYELKKLRILLLLVLMTVATAVMAQESKEHTVARGETMASIAQLYGLTEEQLKAANPNASMCFAGMKLVIPDPAAAAAQGKDGDDKGDKKDDKDKKKDDDGKDSGFKKLLNSVGDALGDAAKVTGTVLSAAAYTKLHGGSTYDVVANSIEAVSNKKEGKKNDFTIRGRKMSERKRSFSKDSDDDGSDDDSDSDGDGDSGDDKKDKKGKKGGTADKAKTKQKDAKAEEEPDPEIEELYQSYVAKYNQAATEMEQLKSVYDKANNTAKIRTWNNVSEAANAFREQMEKYRQDCEKFTGRLIDSAAVESWRPVSPRK